MKEPRAADDIGIDLLEAVAPIGATAAIERESPFARGVDRHDCKRRRLSGRSPDCARLDARGRERPDDKMISDHPRAIAATLADCAPPRRMTVFNILDAVVWREPAAPVASRAPTPMAETGPMLAPALVALVAQLLGQDGEADLAVLRSALRLNTLRNVYFERYDYDLKEALKGDDAAAIQAKTNTLAQASMKLGEAMYKASQGEGGGSDTGGDDAGGKKDDDVVDAEFTEVDDDKKKSA